MSNGKPIDYASICFVIMPFNTKKVDGKDIDFNWIYDHLFAPAIAATPLPEGGFLVPKRTDKDYYSANIDVEMFGYIEYSRFCLADITGINGNVFYELGVRHHSNNSGTAIFRCANTTLPFDINHIKAFPYEYEPVDQAEKTKAFITQVLTESLLYNRLDSPIQVALHAQQHKGRPLDLMLTEISNALKNGDRLSAINKYQQAIAQDPNNPMLKMELGLIYRDMGQWNDAVEQFSLATQLSPQYGEAYRELGIAYGKMKPRNEPLAEHNLKKAVMFNPQDFDAFASLGGIYKRQGNLAESQKMYEQATKVSRGHAYPLLNALILKVKGNGLASLTAQDKFLLSRAEVTRRKQMESGYDMPWCAFDTSTIQLLMGKSKEALSCMENCVDGFETWQLETHIDTLSLLQQSPSPVNGVDELLSLLKERLAFLKGE